MSCHLLRRSDGHHRTSAVTALRSHIDQIIRRLDHIQIMLNDHHGVGIKLGRLMKEQYGPAMQVFEGIKKTLDPNGIMNPFKLGL